MSDGQREPDDLALWRRVSDLADLSFVRRDRCGRDADAASAITL